MPEEQNFEAELRDRYRKTLKFYRGKTAQQEEIKKLIITVVKSVVHKTV